ncbi:hypothetical protein Cycma_3361 [Cyclobacterium marinum DSM 745]|uniref:Uncharacterized protein n=1 Tax=Cyclobacterium marinum (strain ATCC 25205 / DSM 745 / LMG 13164 / NCIMB 1802) TaxID=880070 RepID=G0IW96_CYCMS|nr:hypothetical protein Cycma_3361 [Cyclobacterium marinum DSM 745]|tara:strand:+ start:88730 stop:88846 length:117 start_codon:yes stop_codon:yes gene_type:complete
MDIKGAFVINNVKITKITSKNAHNREKLIYFSNFVISF